LQEVGASFEHPGRAQQAQASRPIASDDLKKPGRIRQALKVGSPRARLLIRLIALALVVGVALIAFASDTTRVRQLTKAVPEIDFLASTAGFGLDQVTVKGHRFTLTSDIFEALELEQARSFVSFDAPSARARIEALSWVASVNFRRVYPNQLDVTVRERDAFAVWRMGPTLSLIDSEGRVLSRIEENSAPTDLPRFSGKGAAKEAASFWADLKGHPAIKQRLLSAERFGQRRWSLSLANDVVIHLPKSGASTALAQLESWPGFDAHLENGNTIIDLRAKGRIVVKPVHGIGPTSSGVRSIADLLDQSG
jgi:cell division protein FtsQ